MPPWTQHVDIHCERLSPDAGAEPVNMYSTIIYLVAAYLAYRSGKAKNTLDRSTKLLLWTMVLITICGFIFHRYANVWSMYLDSIPMYTFQIGFVYLYSSFIARNKPKPHVTATIITIGFVVLNFLVSWFPGSGLNGAETFIPILLFLVMFAYYHNHNIRKNTAILWLSVIAWIIAFFLKSIDIEACDYQRFGTHSLWHVSSAAAMLFAVIGLLTTKEDGRHLRSKKIKGHYEFKKIEEVESLNPHDVVNFDEPTVAISRPSAAKMQESTKPKK